MPNRVIRAAMNDSEAVNRLSFRAEILYHRLLLLVDDYGRYEAKPAILRGKLFWQQLDRWSEEDVATALRECALSCRDNGTPLVRLYQHRNRKYLEITEFRQQLRAKKSIFPAPDGTSNSVMPDSLLSTCDADAMHMSSACEASAHRGVVECEDVVVTNVHVSSEEYVDLQKNSAAAVVVPNEHVLARARAAAAAATASPPSRIEPAPEETPPDKFVPMARELVVSLAEEHRKVSAVGDPGTAVRECAKRLAAARDAPALCAQFRVNHGAFLRYWRAQKQQGNRPFPLHLGKWFRDGDCEFPPGEEACQPPVKPPTAAQAAEEERKRRKAELLGGAYAS